MTGSGVIQDHTGHDDSSALYAQSWLQGLLDQLIAIHQQDYRGSDYSIMTVLAHHHYEPAKPFLITWLTDDNDIWRYESLMALGFYYDVSHDPLVMEKIRHLSLHDHDVQIRACAIGVWASQRRVLDKHMLHVLEHDPDRVVRESALGCILMCYRHIIRGKYHGMMERAKTGKNKDWLTEKGIKKLFSQLEIAWEIGN